MGRRFDARKGVWRRKAGGPIKDLIQGRGATTELVHHIHDHGYGSFALFSMILFMNYSCLGNPSPIVDE